MNAVLENIRARRSIRAFSAQQVPEESLRAILEAGQWAPSARNQQSWHLVAIQNAGLLAELDAALMAGLGRDKTPFYSAPTLTLVFCDEGAVAPENDGALAVENMALAAWSLGVGCCWIHCVREFFATAAGQSFKKRLGVADHYRCIGSLVMGIPEGPAPEPRARREGTLTILR